MSGSSKQISHNLAETSTKTTFSIPVKCGDDVHHIVIDSATLKVYAIDHIVPMYCYEALRDLGGEAPECHRACWAFNELSGSFRDKPEKFWAFIRELSEFVLESTEELTK